jgi:hypothetical protein
MASEPAVRLPRPVLVIQSLHPLRRHGQARIAQLGAFRWSRARRHLEPAEVRASDVTLNDMRPADEATETRA